MNAPLTSTDFNCFHLGRPGTDYPVLGKVPYTNFYCDEQSFPGFYADPETRCQTWHYCDIDGRQTSFLCPNGTQFSQLVFVCDWWFNVRCDLSEKLSQIYPVLIGWLTCIVTGYTWSTADCTDDPNWILLNHIAASLNSYWKTFLMRRMMSDFSCLITLVSLICHFSVEVQTAPVRCNLRGSKTM